MPPVQSPTLPVACFAPPMSDERIAAYTAIAAAAPGPVWDAMRECLAAVKAWWDLPESTRQDVERWQLSHRTDPAAARKPHTFQVVPLEEEHVRQLWDLVPWRYEIEAMQRLFDAIPPDQKELRDAAFHLLWFVTELERDREPLTADKL